MSLLSKSATVLANHRFLQRGHNHKYVNDTNFDHWYF
jgi:hypothetical protein